MTRTILALSPHLDDAVFSAGAAIAARTRAGWRVVVATLFAGGVERPEGFALACQLDKGLGPDVDYMALRRVEDAAACAALGAEPRHEALLEAPHRGYDSAAALFGPPRANDPAAPALEALIAALLRSETPHEVWAPRALGGHVDHVLTHRATRGAALSVSVRWWTDWPYADRPDVADPEASGIAGLPWTDEQADAADAALKADACAAYASQLGFQFGGESAMRVRLAGGRAERFVLQAAL